jgi:O-antigen/teichoic acid export membrane protein
MVSQKGILGEMFGYASYSCIAQVTDLLRFKLHPIIITAFMRFADVTPYAIADRLQNVVVDICGAILSMLTPVFSRQEAQGNQEAMRRSFFLAYKISCYVSLFLLGLLSICAADFITRWLGPGHDLVLTLLYMRVGGSLCGISQMPVVNLLFGTSENRFYAFSNALHAALTLILSIILIRPLGLPGVVLAVVSVTAFVKLFIQAWAACRVLNETLWRFHFRHTVPNLARPVPFLVLAWFLSRLLLGPSYVRVGLFGAGALALFAPYILFIGFTKRERELFFSSLRLARQQKQQQQPSPPELLMTPAGHTDPGEGRCQGD